MIEIKRLQLHQVAEVKRVIVKVCHEILQVSEADIKRYDTMSDIDDVRAHYFDDNGTFLVLLDDSRVVGSCAIRRLTGEICELKRIWFLKDYRGRGLGRKMADMLLDFASIAGYTKVRLDIVDEQKQAPAVKFYKQLGFYAIERYNDGLCTVFMEKMLCLLV